MTDYCYSCKHHPIKKLDKKTGKAFCLNCGAMELTINKRRYSLIKPEKFNYEVEVDPIEMIIRSINNINIPVKPHDRYTDNRKSLIDYMKKIIKVYKFSYNTLHLSAFIMDLIFSRDVSFMSEEMIEMCTIACFLIAVKFIENDPYVPDLCKFQSSFEPYCYSTKDIRKCEDFCLKALKFKLDYYTAYDIMVMMLNNGIVFHDEVFSSNELSKVYSFAYSLLNSLVSNKVYLYSNSLQLALAVVNVTRNHFKLKPERTRILTEVYCEDASYYEPTVAQIEKSFKINCDTAKCAPKMTNPNPSSPRMKDYKKTELEVVEEVVRRPAGKSKTTKEPSTLAETLKKERMTPDLTKSYSIKKSPLPKINHKVHANKLNQSQPVLKHSSSKNIVISKFAIDADVKRRSSIKNFSELSNQFSGNVIITNKHRNSLKTDRGFLPPLTTIQGDK